MEQINYAHALASGLTTATFATFVGHELPHYLSNVWCDDYQRSFRDAKIVSVPLDNFTYLFDLTAERNLAAYGIMGEKNTMARDCARMSGYPKGEDSTYHRGHMIPHSGGGPTDINLFIQRGAVNVGPFRELERLAIENPGSFYFVRLLYGLGPSQRPSFVEQGLFLNTRPPKVEVRFFPN